jgi:hypothetical protein
MKSRQSVVNSTAIRMSIEIPAMNRFFMLKGLTPKAILLEVRGCSESIHTRDITNELLDTKEMRNSPFSYRPHHCH